jgi:hypothetical protein
LFGDDDQDILVPHEAQIQEKVALLEFNATSYINWPSAIDEQGDGAAAPGVASDTVQGVGLAKSAYRIAWCYKLRRAVALILSYTAVCWNSPTPDILPN